MSEENWQEDIDGLFEVEDIRVDYIERVEEAQKAVAWAAEIYRELYGDLPKGSWSDALNQLVQVSNQFKQELAASSEDKKT